MLKIIGLVFLCLSVASIGFIYSESLRKRKVFFEKLSHFASNSVNEMRRLNCNIFEIFKSNANDELKFLKEINTDNLQNRNTVVEIIKGTKVDGEDVGLITDFIIKFGVSDIKSQTAHCRYFAEKFDLKQKEAEQKYSEKGRLSVVLSVLIALALFIILI